MIIASGTNASINILNFTMLLYTVYLSYSVAMLMGKTIMGNPGCYPTSVALGLILPLRQVLLRRTAL